MPCSAMKYFAIPSKRIEYNTIPSNPSWKKCFCLWEPFWVAYQKWMSHFWRLGPKKWRKRPVSGHPREKRSFYPLEFFGLIPKRPGYGLFFAKNPFSPTDEFVFVGLGWRSALAGQMNICIVNDTNIHIFLMLKVKKVKMILLALLPRPEAHGRGKGGQKRPQIREAGGGGTNQGRNWKCQQKVIRAKS